MSQKEIKERVTEMFLKKIDTYYISLRLGVPQKQVYHIVEQIESARRKAKQESL